MTDDPRYAEGLALFRSEHWFESHEVLEGLWRETPKGPDRELLQGLIQLAVSLEHWRRNNPRGAWGQWNKARARLQGLSPDHGGLALGALLDDFTALWTHACLEAAVADQAAGRTPECPVFRWPTPRPAAPDSPAQ